MTTEITRALAIRLLEVVDQGLTSGLGSPEPGKFCVEAAVKYVLGEPHGDNPSCVAPALRRLKLRLNDAVWSSNAARAKGMRRLALIQLGSAGHLDEREFARRVGQLALRNHAPRALKAAATIFRRGTATREHLLSAADLCERGDMTYDTARQLRSWAYDIRWGFAASAAVAAADAAADAAAVAAAVVAAEQQFWAAYQAALERGSASRDAQLAEFAEGAVQILIEMGVPGAQWLGLTEEAA